MLEVIDENSDGNSSEEVHYSLFSSDLFYSSKPNNSTVDQKNRGKIKKEVSEFSGNLNIQKTNKSQMMIPLNNLARG